MDTMDDRLTKPLSSIIQEREQTSGGSGSRRGPNSLKAQSSKSTSLRHAPYEGRGNTERNDATKMRNDGVYSMYRCIHIGYI
jgi:hypothetical protein